MVPGIAVQKPAVGEALVDGKIGSKHGAHHVVLLQIHDGFRFERRMKIARQLKQPEIGCPTLSAEIFNAFLSIPVGATLPFRSHPSFDLQGVVVNPTDSAHKVLVPSVSAQWVSFHTGYCFLARIFVGHREL